MSKRQTEDRIKDAVPPAGKNLTKAQRQQIEKKEFAEHETGSENETAISETQELDEQ